MASLRRHQRRREAPPEGKRLPTGTRLQLPPPRGWRPKELCGVVLVLVALVRVVHVAGAAMMLMLVALVLLVHVDNVRATLVIVVLVIVTLVGIVDVTRLAVVLVLVAFVDVVCHAKLLSRIS